jgi:16S rRNA (adenine1518-N6/adenine1519-N6)-dimethyltransferase
MRFQIKKNYGQHFLNEKKIIDKIIDIQEIKNNDVIEIGPGFGSLTNAIIEKKPNSFLVIEKDLSLKKHLESIKKNKFKKLNLLFDDALSLNLQEISNSKKVFLIANLPYNIATTLIVNWIKYIKFFYSITVMVQKEVADRLIAKVSTKPYGRLSVLMQLHCKLEKQFDVEPENFFPPPKVVSSVIKITPAENIDLDYDKVDQLLKDSFFSRRKIIKNNLQKKYHNIERIFIENNLDISKRAQDISPKDFLKISESLS